MCIMDSITEMFSSSSPTSKHNLVNLLPPHLHLTTSKVMVIVWRLRGKIIRTVLYIANGVLLMISPPSPPFDNI